MQDSRTGSYFLEDWNFFYIPCTLEYPPMLQFPFYGPSEGSKQNGPHQPAPYQSLGDQPYEFGQIFLFKAECQDGDSQVYDHKYQVIGSDPRGIAGQ